MILVSPLPPWAILQRIAVPFALFSSVLTVLLLASTLVVLPRFTRVEVNDTSYSALELQQRRAELEAHLADLERKRDQLVLATNIPLYRTVKERKNAAAPPLAVWSLLKDLAKSVVTQNDAVHLSSLRYRPQEQQVEASGDVRFCGPRSMTVLAEFVELLTKNERVTGLSRPQFIREVDSAIGPHSPFTLSFTLK
jgi:hypothetical protein